MNYIIQTSVGNFQYYVRIIYEGARYYDFVLEGLKNNASKFPTPEIAEQILSKVRCKTPLTVVKY